MFAQFVRRIQDLSYSVLHHFFFLKFMHVKLGLGKT